MAEIPTPPAPPSKTYDPDKAGKMPGAGEQALAAAETPPPKAPEETPPPPAEEKKVEAADPKKLTAKAAMLSKREAEIKRRETELAAREKTTKEIETKGKTYEDARKKAKEDPIAFMEEHGLTYDEVTQFVLNGKRPTEKTKFELQQERIAALEKKIEEDGKAREKLEIERQQRDIDKSIADYKVKLGSFIEANPETFELIIANGQTGKDTVWEVIQAHFDETGETLDGEVASKMVEEYYLEEAKRYVGTKKIAGKKEEPKVPPATTTLTNQGLASAASASNVENLSREESLKKIKESVKFIN